jgi:signal transduction histidine kinase/CheY-like chemotaxis protein
MGALSLLLAAGTLATGELSSLDNDPGSRLFFLMLAWDSPALFFLHYDLLSRPSQRVATITLWGFVALATIWSLPPLIWTRPALEEMAWSALWIDVMQFTLFLSAMASLALLVWQANRGETEARRRPVRLVAFGNMSAIAPALLLSLIPRLLALPIKIPWEGAFLGLLMSPVFYAYSLARPRAMRARATLKRVGTYYLFLVLFCVFFLVGATLLDHFAAPNADRLSWSLLVGAVSLLLVQALSGEIEQLMDWVWFGKGTEYTEAMEQLIASLTVSPERGKLERLLCHDLVETMRLSCALLLIRDGDEGLSPVESTEAVDAEGIALSLTEDDALKSYLISHDGPLYQGQVRASLARANLKKGERKLLSLFPPGSLWLPLVSREALQGLLLMGPKTGDDYFTLEDERILKTLGYQAGIAAHNVRLREEREAIEGQLAKARELEAVGQLAAGIAHDFNNVLTSMIGLAEMLQADDSVPEGAREDLGVIVAEGERAADLIQQILDFGRKSIVRRRPLDLVSLLEDLVGFLRRTIPESVRITLERGTDTYRVRSDPTMMEQMITNLALNASDAMPEGGELRLAVHRFTLGVDERPPVPDMQPGDWIALSVADTGAGISEEALPHIYEPFFTTKEVGEGTGLGLAQVYGIVKQHEGHIDVETEEGEGTTFTVYLPALGPEEEGEETAAGPMRRGQGETILVVEDERLVLDTICRMLEAEGYRALPAVNGEGALKVYRRHGTRIALVLTDVVMPTMGGRDLIDALRTQGADVPIAVMSGYPLDEEDEELFDHGVIEWIQKPIGHDELTRLLNEAFGGDV